MSDTTLAPGTPEPASSVHFEAAIVRLRKKCQFVERKRAAFSPPSAAKPGSRSRMSRLPVAWLRMCSSSPWCRPCAASLKISIGPDRSMSRPMSGPRSSRKKRRRSIASSASVPNHSVLPAPSLNVENARAPDPSSSTTHTGIDGEHTPVIAPTWLCSLPEARPISPVSIISRARSRLRAQPSNRVAATSARRCGSASRCGSIGGPEWMSVRPSASTGRTSRAVAIADGARRCAASIRSTTCSLASATVAAVDAPERARARATASGSPDAGGRQSTSTTGVSWSRIASPNASSPMLTTSTFSSTA